MTDNHHHIGSISNFEAHWERGWLDCPYAKSDMVFVNDHPPLECPYILEHTIF
jgi:hypothetical protein